MFNKLKEFICDKINELSIEERSYYDSIYGTVNSINEDTDSIKNHLGKIEYDNDEAKKNIIDSINSMYESIEDTLNANNRIPLTMYEDLSKFQKDSTKQFEEIKKKLSQLSWFGDKLKEITEVIFDVQESLKDLEVTEDPEETEEIAKLLADYNSMVNNVRVLEIEKEKLAKKNDDLLATLKSLDDSLALVTQGVYNQDTIEFAAVKTYRDGWKYICYNGRQLTNFDGIDTIDFNWDSREKYIHMNISFQGE